MCIIITDDIFHRQVHFLFNYGFSIITLFTENVVKRDENCVWDPSPEGLIYVKSLRVFYYRFHFNIIKLYFFCFVYFLSDFKMFPENEAEI